MIYVMSDIHGEYEKYQLMLKKIDFSDRDTLYVLGDVVDRGAKPMEVLNDMSLHSNIFPLIGNHDIIAYSLFKKFPEGITLSDSFLTLDENTRLSVEEWLKDGGASTIESFLRLNQEDREFMLEYLEEFALYETVEINNKTFILVHAGLGGFDENRSLKEYTLENLAFSRHDYQRRYYQDPSKFIVTGHTPTIVINGTASIYHNNNNICIDCGACFQEGRLACLCLNTMEEYYV